MADPFTPAFIAANCIWALIQNRTDAAAVNAVKRLARHLRKQELPANHDVLKAAHSAFVSSIQLMATACENSAGNPVEHFAARRLIKLATDPAFTTFEPANSSIPKAELDHNIRAIFAGSDKETSCNAASVIVAHLEAVLNEPLPGTFRTLFRAGHGNYPSWPQAFERFFAEQVKANERVFRALSLDRLNEIIHRAETQSADVARLHQAIVEGLDASATRDARMDTKLDQLLREVMDLRGGQIQAARIEHEAIVRIARKVAENVVDLSQALAEIDAAIDDLLALRRDAARASNLDQLIEVALKRIDERAAAGEFDAAAREAASAFAEWEQREAERRERERAVGVRFAEENVRTHRLRRDADAAAQWILRKVAIEASDTDELIEAGSRELTALIENGRDRGVNLDLEIAAELGRLLFNRAETPDVAAATLVWKAHALQVIGERVADTEALEEAITAYRKALTVYTRERKPVLWATIWNNLGTALLTLGGRQQGTQTIEEAIAGYRKVLEVVTREDAATEWATMQSNLGNALQELGERQDNSGAIEEAIAAYRSALTVVGPEGRSLEWAMIQNNLGTALQTLGNRNGDTEALEEAIVAYRAALQVYTREQLPLDWAMTQNNLGNAFASLGSYRDGVGAMEEAVTAFRAALEIYTADRLPLQWATTQNNLANVLMRLGNRKEHPASLDEAIATYEAALGVYRRDALPLQWALTMENVGNCALVKAVTTGDCTSARKAVVAFEAALEVFAHPDLGRYYATARASLDTARALSERLCGPE